MTLNGCTITGDGEKCGQEAAQEAGTPLPLRPARAIANDKGAWEQANVVAPDSDKAPIAPMGKAPTGPIQKDYMN